MTSPSAFSQFTPVGIWSFCERDQLSGIIRRNGPRSRSSAIRSNNQKRYHSDGDDRVLGFLRSHRSVCIDVWMYVGLPSAETASAETITSLPLTEIRQKHCVVEREEKDCGNKLWEANSSRKPSGTGAAACFRSCCVCFGLEQKRSLPTPDSGFDIVSV